MQPARHNHQPTHQQGTKWAGKAWPKKTKNANFGPNLVVLGHKLQIFIGESKSFGTLATEKTPRHLVHIVFWSGKGQNGPKMPILGPKWPKMPILCQNLPFSGQKPSILSGGSKSFGTHTTEKPPTHIVCIVFWSVMGPNGPKMPIFGQKCQFRAKFGRLWAKNPIFLGLSKSFGTHITEKPPRQLVRIVFWSSIQSNGPKMPIFAQKCQFLAKFGRF